MIKLIIYSSVVTLIGLSPARASKSDEHDHKADEKESHSAVKDEHGHADEEHTEEDGEAHADHDDHKKDDEHAADKDEHGHGDEHTEEEEENSVAGPDKGILEKGEKGFKLSPEATKTFELKTENIKSKTIDISKKSLVEIKNDKFIYRIRDGWIKKIAVKVLRKDKTQATVDLSQFKDGDQIITNGVGYVRTAELVVEEGVTSGHSH